MSQLNYSLHCGRSQKPILRIMPCGALFKIEWPDGTLSDIANLTRCKDAALEWAEQDAITKHRNLSVAQRLKLLANFSWSSSYVAQNERPAA